jgi:hypothetical protein
MNKLMSNNFLFFLFRPESSSGSEVETDREDQRKTKKKVMPGICDDSTGLAITHWDVASFGVEFKHRPGLECYAEKLPLRLVR